MTKFSRNLMFLFCVFFLCFMLGTLGTMEVKILCKSGPRSVHGSVNAVIIIADLMWR